MRQPGRRLKSRLKGRRTRIGQASAPADAMFGTRRPLRGVQPLAKVAGQSRDRRETLRKVVAQIHDESTDASGWNESGID
jgi:hypothetical protein